jgi:hypothetical protein
MRDSPLDLLAATAIFIGAGFFLLAFDPFTRPVVLDPATWDYMSLALTEGRVPYRDIFLHKTPGALFLGAAGAAIAEALGKTPLAGVRAVFLALGAAGPALLFSLCRRTQPALVAVAAAAWMLAFEQWPLAALEGARPKVATTVFGLAALLAARRGRPLTAGAAASVSALCWQPGLAFAVGAAWELRQYTRGAHSALLAPSRFRHPVRAASTYRRAAIGLVGPPLVLGLYLAANGALSEFFSQAVSFNVDYIQLHAKTPGQSSLKILELLLDWNPLFVLLAPAAAAGMWLGRNRIPAGLVVAGCIYVGMMFINAQAWPDTILLAPFAAALLAAGLSGLATNGVRKPVARTVPAVLAVIAALAISNPRLEPPISYADQAAFMQGLEADLLPADRVLVVSLPEFLIHTGRHSVWPWPYLWFGVDRYAAEHTEGGFAGMLSELERSDPALLLICRRWNGPLRRRFDAWALPRYTRQRVWFYPHTVRPMNVYRRRTGSG